MRNGFTASHYARRDRLKKQIAAKLAEIRRFKDNYNLLENNDNFHLTDIPTRTIVLMRSNSLDRAQ
jgi:hypothetical protein